MKKLLLALFLGSMLYSSSTQAQEFSLSQFYTSPLSLNPAFTGLVNGQYRVTGNYRSQFGDVSLGQQTFGASFDIPFNKFGIGIWAHNSSKGEFNNTSANISAAYHIKLDDRGFNRLSFGVQGGAVQKSLGDLIFVDPTDIPAVTSTLNPDINAGLMYYNTSIFNVINPFLGASVYHIIEGAESFVNSTVEPFILERTINVYGGFQFNQKRTFDIVPQALVSLTGRNTRISVGAVTHYFLKDADASVLLGSHFRLNEAVSVEGGIQYGDFAFGLSYDVNFSPLSRAINGGNDGFEISLIYIKKKRIKNNRDKICPRL
ncbi:MAG: type IX secretion system PorP/SprF family membrane protein [Sphingobacteriales bacterium]|jgi:type IX secretion system PorP/SprF family membrane protein